MYGPGKRRAAPWEQRTREELRCGIQALESRPLYYRVTQYRILCIISTWKSMLERGVWRANVREPNVFNCTRRPMAQWLAHQLRTSIGWGSIPADHQFFHLGIFPSGRHVTSSNINNPNSPLDHHTWRDQILVEINFFPATSVLVKWWSVYG